jgi:hypothetical protein
METVPSAGRSFPPGRELDRLVPSDHPVETGRQLITALARVRPSASDSTRETHSARGGLWRQYSFVLPADSEKGRVPDTVSRKSFAPVALPPKPHASGPYFFDIATHGRALPDGRRSARHRDLYRRLIRRQDPPYDGLWMIGGPGRAGDVFPWSGPAGQSHRSTGTGDRYRVLDTVGRSGTRARFQYSRDQGAVFFSSADVAGVALPVGGYVYIWQ